MSTTDSYMAIAQDYADGVRVLFAPTGAPAGERGGHGPISHEELAEQAENLLTPSASLTAAATDRLAADDPSVRAQVSIQLLAKALTDLEVSAYLLQAAEDEEATIAWAKSEGAERSVAGRASIEENLKILLGEAPPVSATERRRQKLRNLNAARVSLCESIEDALTLISDRASKTGQMALSGLLGLGLAELGSVVGHIGQNLAQAFGVADKMTRLYQLFRDFALKAYDSLIALLGQNLAQAAGQQVLKWIDEIKEAKFFGGLLKELYQTEQTQKALASFINNSQANPKKFSAAIERVEGLNEAYAQQIR